MSTVVLIKWLMMTSSNRNIFRVIGPLWGEPSVTGGFPLTKASDAELWCFLWSASEHVTVMQHFVWSRANWLSQTQLIVDGRGLSVGTERFIKVHTKNVSWIIPPGWIYANTFNKWRRLISPQIVSKRVSKYTLYGSAMNINDSDNMKWKHMLNQRAWVKEITLQTSPFPDQQIKHKLW